MPIGRPSRGVPGRGVGRSAWRGGAVVARTSLWDAVQGSGSGEGGGQPWGLAVSGEEPLGYSDEEVEGIVPLTDDAEAFGPEALLLLGLTPDEIEKVRAALAEAEASFISLLSADESVADITLWDAMERAAQPFPSVRAPSVAAAPATTGALPAASDSSSVWPNNVGERVCIVSGLSGIEIMDLVEIISSLDIPRMEYAANAAQHFHMYQGRAMVPKSAARPVKEVVIKQSFSPLLSSFPLPPLTYRPWTMVYAAMVPKSAARPLGETVVKHAISLLSCSPSPCPRRHPAHGVCSHGAQVSSQASKGGGGGSGG
ncbi:unnamed protein product [Closterium sp. NIES-65]|nr:unnamed protein product [Closterium sp. NIES-65]